MQHTISTVTERFDILNAWEFIIFIAFISCNAGGRKLVFIRETVPVIQIHAFAKNCVHIPSFCSLQTLDKEGTLKIKKSILSINQQLPLLAPMNPTILVNLLQVQVINAA